MGSLVCSPLVTIVDDATSPLLPGVPFDAEGTPTRRHVLIDHGVAAGVTHDRASAALAGTTSTGHALPAPNHEGGFATHLVIEPGADDQDRLVAGMERGLLVTRFHYTNLAHAMTSTITGMTRDGTFLVEDGRIVASVRNLRFTQSILEALSHVEAVGSSCEVSSDTFEGSAASPAMRISRFHFTSTSGHCRRATRPIRLIAPNGQRTAIRPVSCITLAICVCKRVSCPRTNLPRPNRRERDSARHTFKGPLLRWASASNAAPPPSAAPADCSPRAQRSP